MTIYSTPQLKLTVWLHHYSLVYVGQFFCIWLYTMREQYHARIATVALNQMEELYIPHKYVMQNIPGLRYMYLLFA